MAEKIKIWLKSSNSDIYLTVIIVMVALISFALGRISVLKEKKFDIEIIGAQEVKPPLGSLTSKSEGPPDGQAGNLVGSKNGTAYHLLTCPGAKQIKEENKIYFSTKEDAQKAGYHPAGNCPGLE